MVDVKQEAFHAVLEQVEPSLFRATYRGDVNPDAASDGQHILPDMHIGTDVAAVKMWVEQLAAARGYTKVVWDELPPNTNATAH